MAEPIRLQLIDSQTLLRRSLVPLLNRRRGLLVVGEAPTAREGLDQALALRPDIVVVDPHVSDGGPNLVADLCRQVPECRVLVLALGDDVEAAGRALLAGASGYLEKSCEPDDLVQAISRVHAGEMVVQSDLAMTLMRDGIRDASSEPSSGGLTERELEVLRLITHGLTNAAIARQLFITEHTVKGHLAKILGKLGLENRVQLATYAMQQGIAEPAESEGLPRQAVGDSRPNR